MKFISFLLTVFIGLNVSAYSIKIQVLEGWKSTPLENCTVIFETSSGEFLDALTTDFEGMVQYENSSKDQVRVYAIDSLRRFENDLPIYAGKSNQNFTIILYPNILYEVRMRRIEDSIYQKKDQVDSNQVGDFVENQLDSLTNEDYGEINKRIKAFIYEHVLYPEISRELGDQGIVYVEFIIEPDGVITQVTIARGVSKELDQEAKRLIRAMPPLSSIYSNKAAPRMRLRCPITFTLH